IRIPVQRIVLDDLWYRAQSRLEENKALSRRNVKRQYLLRGLLFCPECGSRLAGKARNDRRFYRCNNVDKLNGSRICSGSSYITASRVERTVWNAVADALKNPELLVAQYREQLSDSSVADEYELTKKQIALALKRVVVQEDRMTDAYRNEAIELNRFKIDMQKLSQRRKGLEKQQEELQLRKVQEESRQTALEHLERFCGEVATGLSNLTFEERQHLLRLVVERVIVRDNLVRVETVIPSDRQRAGLLRTRHPELDSGSAFKTEQLIRQSQPGAAGG
ncbi:MAG: recombinase zinc beta ribbon domain-containing protein, partial [Chloroflexi bacterium]|nr:recombinase zinc beta ribbon domain-containing protein [Chloroflexota bacterium]